MLLIRRSALAARMVTESEPELLAGFGSGSFAEILATLVAEGEAVLGATVIVTFTPAKTPMFPILQVTVPAAWLQLPSDEVADRKVTPAGNVSVMMTPVAPAGPLLFALIEKEIFWPLPKVTGSGE